MGNGEYLRQDLHVEIDAMTTMSTHAEEFGELLSDPSTWIAASKKLPESPSDDVKPLSPYSHCRRKAIASSEELQRQLSISEMSNPELVDNDSSEYWTASEESLIDYASEVGDSPRVPYYDEWNSWFPPDRTSQQTLPVRGSSLSNIQHEFAMHTHLISDDQFSSTQSLPQRALSKSRGKQLHLRKQASCIAFPQLAQSSFIAQPLPSQIPVKLHQSWPLESKASRPALRDRANTTPQPQDMSQESMSSLSHCVSLDDVHSTRLTYNSSPDYNDHLYMRSPPWSPFNTSFSSTFSTNTFSTQISSSHHEIEAEAAFSEFLMDQSASCFFHDDDDGEEERLWLEKQRAKFEFETRGIYRDPTSLPLLSDPPRLTPHHRSNSSISSSFQKSSKPKKKKSSLGKQAKEFFSSSLSLTSRKSSSKLSTAFREQSGIDTPPPTPPFRAPPFLSSPIRKEKKGAYKTCPKCNWGALQKRESCDGAKMVTCLCHADLCFGCLRDWDYCEGTCT